MIIFSPNTIIKSAEINANFTESLGMTGEIRMWPTNSAPTGWLFCQGQAISRVTYSTLYALIGTTYGIGDGSNTFNLPDYQDRFPIGKSGTKAIGSTGGAASINLQHSHTVASHTHTGPSHTHTGPSHTHSGPSHTHAIDANTGITIGGNTAFGAGSLGPDGNHYHNLNANTTASGQQETGAAGTGATSAAGTGATGGTAPGTDNQLSTTQSIQNPYQAINFVIKY